MRTECAKRGAKRRAKEIGDLPRHFDRRYAARRQALAAKETIQSSSCKNAATPRLEQEEVQRGPVEVASDKFAVPSSGEYNPNTRAHQEGQPQNSTSKFEEAQRPNAATRVQQPLPLVCTVECVKRTISDKYGRHAIGLPLTLSRQLFEHGAVGPNGPKRRRILLNGPSAKSNAKVARRSPTRVQSCRGNAANGRASRRSKASSETIIGRFGEIATGSSERNGKPLSCQGGGRARSN